MSGDRALIDTNILVYAVDESEPAKQRVCKELLRECWNRKRDFAVSVQNLSEFYTVATSAKRIENPIPKKAAQKFVSLIVNFQNWKVIAPTAQTIPAAINLSIEHNTHYWDAAIAATMRENGVFSIYTEDRNHYTRIPWLTVTNPFDPHK